MNKIICNISMRGNIEWATDNIRHNNYGPAVILNSGAKGWYFNGCFHRLDSPAVLWSDGDKRWWVNGIRYHTEFEYWIAVQQYFEMNQHTIL